MRTVRFLAVFVFIAITFCNADEYRQEIRASWQWADGELKPLHQVATIRRHDKSIMMMQIPFELSTEQKIHRMAIPHHPSLHALSLADCQILNCQGYQRVIVDQHLVNEKIISTLKQAQGNLESAKLTGIVNLYFQVQEPTNRGPSGNCFKCYGKGKLGTWCTFCHAFVSWCIHGKSLHTCDACSGIGWIDTDYQRCPHCNGKGWVGTWCTFCHAHVIWCMHGKRWHSCCTCNGKGALKPGFSKCSKCNGRGWHGSKCPFCHATVIWCIHGRSPVTCNECHGKGCVWNKQK